MTVQYIESERIGWVKKVNHNTLYSTHNFIKYWPIFIILSLSQSPGNLLSWRCAVSLKDELSRILRYGRQQLQF